MLRLLLRNTTSRDETNGKKHVCSYNLLAFRQRTTYGYFYLKSNPINAMLRCTYKKNSFQTENGFVFFLFFLFIHANKKHWKCNNLVQIKYQKWFVCLRVSIIIVYSLWLAGWLAACIHSIVCCVKMVAIKWIFMHFVHIEKKIGT